MIRPETLFSISNTIRPGVAETISFCLRGIPAARRNSRESTIRFEASSSTVVFMVLIWRGHGVFARLDESPPEGDLHSVLAKVSRGENNNLFPGTTTPLAASYEP
jgi:hypothetical protein